MYEGLFRRTPQLTDDLIMAQRRPGGLAVDSTAEVLKRHGAYQAKKDLAADTAQQGLDLAKKRLDLSGRQFKDIMGFEREQFNRSKRDAMTANIIGGLGVGVSAYGNYRQGQMDIELQKKMDERFSLMDDYWKTVIERLRER